MQMRCAGHDATAIQLHLIWQNSQSLSNTGQSAKPSSPNCGVCTDTPSSCARTAGLQWSRLKARRIKMRYTRPCRGTSDMQDNHACAEAHGGPSPHRETPLLPFIQRCCTVI